MASTLGSLVVDLSANTARFQSDLGRAYRIADNTMKGIGKLAAGLGVTIGSIGFGAMIKGAIDSADAMRKMSQAAGLSVEQFSAFVHAGELSGVNTQELAQILGKLSKNMADTAANTGEAREAFKSLGINVKDANGNLKSSDALMLEIADKFAGMEDGAGKTALAMRLFGESGIKMIPMLNTGSNGIRQMADEARKLGLVISQETAAGAEAFNDNLTRMGAVSHGIASNIAAQLLPTMTNLTDMLVEAAKDAELMDKAARVASTGLKLLVSGGIIVSTVFDALGKSVGSVGAALMATVRGDFAGAFTALHEGGTDIKASITDATASILRVWDETASKAEAGAPEMGKKLAAPIIQSNKTIKSEADKAREAIDSQILSLQEQLITFGQTEKQATLYKLAMAGATQTQLNHASAILDAIDIMRKQKEEQEEIANIIEDTRTPFERYTEQVFRLQELFEKGAIDIDTFTRAIEQQNEKLENASKKTEETTDEMSEFWKGAAQGMQNAMADFLFDPFDKGIKGMLTGFIDVVRRMVAEALAAQILKALLGDIGTTGKLGGIVGDWFGGARATGGAVVPGMAYLVGEQGTELFVPPSAGSIVPNTQLQQAAPAQQNIRIVNAFDMQVIDDYLGSDAGEKLIINTVRRNREALGA